jgi:hypothetical protein
MGFYENCHPLRDGAILVYTRPGQKKTAWHTPAVHGQHDMIVDGPFFQTLRRSQREMAEIARLLLATTAVPAILWQREESYMPDSVCLAIGYAAIGVVSVLLIATILEAARRGSQFRH